MLLMDNNLTILAYIKLDLRVKEGKMLEMREKSAYFNLIPVTVLRVHTGGHYPSSHI